MQQIDNFVLDSCGADCIVESKQEDILFTEAPFMVMRLQREKPGEPAVTVRLVDVRRPRAHNKSFTVYGSRAPQVCRELRKLINADFVRRSSAQVVTGNPFPHETANSTPKR